MHTKCPECQIAFRVTAKILQVAGGNVRCGNCDHVFNALAFLAEDPPEEPAPGFGHASRDDRSDDLAETSSRLLKTLDELAGPEDVRIEDTGSEWRVLDTEAPAEPAEELRFDDNTPLPDDFDDEGENAQTPSVIRRRREEQAPFAEKSSERQQDIALSEPEDWTDLLDEFLEPDADSLEVEEELAAIHTELSGVAATLKDDGGAPPLPGLQAGDTEGEPEPELEVTASGEADALDLGESGDARKPGLDVEESDEPSAPDFDVEAAAADADLNFEPEASEEEAGPDLEFDADKAATRADSDEDVAEAGYDTGSVETAEETIAAMDAELAGVSQESDPDIAPGDNERRDVAADEASESTEAGADKEEEPAEPVLTVLADGSSTDEVSPEKENPALFVPEPSEDEMSVNMEIDQELLAAAAEDEGSTATLATIEDPEKLFDQNPEEVETIIMEGEFIRGAMDEEGLDAEKLDQDLLADGIDPADTYALNRRDVGRRWWQIQPPSAGMTTGAIILLLLLAAQIVHNSRESLATMGFFNQTIAPIYRMIGMPVTPAWDIRGWQFEVTNGSVNEDETLLTIVSRLGNRSPQPLPYPLLHVSLTDRWEDIMGSRVLEPADYLPDGLDPSRPVQPGDNFTAVIAIQDPSIEATGFKLNVCYRVTAGTVRCAIEAFKH